MRPHLCRIVVVTLTLLGLAAGTGRGQELIYGMTAASNANTDAGVGLVSFNSTTPGTINTIGRENWSAIRAGSFSSPRARGAETETTCRSSPGWECWLRGRRCPSCLVT
jgi:hypothetical protein